MHPWYPPAAPMEHQCNLIFATLIFAAGGEGERERRGSGVRGVGAIVESVHTAARSVPVAVRSRLLPIWYPSVASARPPLFRVSTIDSDTTYAASRVESSAQRATNRHDFFLQLLGNIDIRYPLESGLGGPNWNRGPLCSQRRMCHIC